MKRTVGRSWGNVRVAVIKCQRSLKPLRGGSRDACKIDLTWSQKSSAVAWHLVAPELLRSYLGKSGDHNAPHPQVTSLVLAAASRECI